MRPRRRAFAPLDLPTGGDAAKVPGKRAMKGRFEMSDKLFMFVRHGRSKGTVSPLYLEKDDVVEHMELGPLLVGEDVRASNLGRFLNKARVGGHLTLFSSDDSNEVDCVVVRITPNVLAPGTSEHEALHCPQINCKHGGRISQLGGSCLQWKREGYGLMLVHQACAWYENRWPLDSSVNWRRFSAITRANGFSDFEAADLFRAIAFLAKNAPSSH